MIREPERGLRQLVPAATVDQARASRRTRACPPRCRLDRFVAPGVWKQPSRGSRFRRTASDEQRTSAGGRPEPERYRIHDEAAAKRRVLPSMPCSGDALGVQAGRAACAFACTERRVHELDRFSICLAAIATLRRLGASAQCRSSRIATATSSSSVPSGARGAPTWCLCIASTPPSRVALLRLVQGSPRSGVRDTPVVVVQSGRSARRAG